jgi:hypothetical protein
LDCRPSCHAMLDVAKLPDEILVDALPTKPTHIDTYTHTPTCTHTYIHIHTHIHTHVYRRPRLNHLSEPLGLVHEGPLDRLEGAELRQEGQRRGHPTGGAQMATLVCVVRVCGVFCLLG